MSSSAERGPDSDALPSYDTGPDGGPADPWYGRRGRLTPQQITDFALLYDRFGLVSPDAVRAWRPTVLEVGFGSGESVLGYAELDRTRRVLGVEPFAPGVLALMRGLDRAEVVNVRVCRTSVVALLPQLAPGQLELVRVFFPDPWPKRRHAGRRLVRQEFVARVAELLGSGGVLHVATDIAAYAHDVDALLSSFPELVPADPPVRARTRYETNAVRAGRPVHDLAWRKLP